MKSLLVRRLVQAVPVLLIVICLDFLLLHLAPGDAVDALAVELGGSDAGLVAQLRADYGLDQPWPVQLGLYLSHVVRLDLGWSVGFSRPVLGLVLERAGNTALLMAAALALALSCGTLLGVAAARQSAKGRAGRWADTLITGFGLLLYAMPGFWIGLMLIVAFAVKLRWLPLAGLAEVPDFATGWAAVADTARHLVLPAVALALMYVAIYLRLMRAGMLEVAGSDYVRTARAKGLSPRRITWRHVVRNALLPMVTLFGVHFGSALGGSVVIESVFAIPGLGRLAYEAVTRRDLTLLLGIILASAVMVILVNLAVDLLYSRLDPRLRRR
ncbi:MULTISPECIES: ABC transporter permease [unclassified Inquilinus]|uniref:ABC transporter permease n=1 Tax=unclassified Inquilinus TaxID=2645927 RepID=UPI003F938C7C